MTMSTALLDATAKVQEGLRVIEARFASLEGAEREQLARQQSAVAATLGAQDKLSGVLSAVKNAEAALSAKNAEIDAAQAKASTIVKAAKEESARLVDEAREKHDEVYKQLAASNEELASVQANVKSARAELDNVREKIAQAKADALKAFSR